MTEFSLLERVGYPVAGRILRVLKMDMQGQQSICVNHHRFFDTNAPLDMWYGMSVKGQGKLS